MTWKNRAIYLECKSILDKICPDYDENKEESNILVDLPLRNHNYAMLSVFIDNNDAEVAASFTVNMNEENKDRILEFTNIVNSRLILKAFICDGLEIENIFNIQILRVTKDTIKSDITYILTVLLECDKALKAIEDGCDAQVAYDACGLITL